MNSALHLVNGRCADAHSVRRGSLYAGGGHARDLAADGHPFDNQKANTVGVVLDLVHDLCTHATSDAAREKVGRQVDHVRQVAQVLDKDGGKIDKARENLCRRGG